MKLKRIRSTRAVTLTELLVVLAIISLLATIAVPVYLNQMHRARVATAQAEVRSIAEAQQMVAIAHGFYVPIHILDNVPNAETGSVGPTSSRDDFQGISASLFVIDAGISMERFNVVNQPTLSTSSIDPRVEKMIETWQGPFLNPRRVRYVGSTESNPASGNFKEDLVVDPWGNPYRMYTDLGIVGNASAPTAPVSASQLSITMDDGKVTTNDSARFDRFAVVSYGPNGADDFTGTNPIDQGDDIYYTFAGLSGNETRYSGF